MTPVLVLDASVALAWCFADEATPAAWQVLSRLESESATAPSLMVLEVANILALAERKGRITAAPVAEFVNLIDALPIEIDEETTARALKQVLDLARSARLTAYDACYLELAMRRGLPLASKDARLREAATRLGVALLGA
ncbi:MAG: type II toxin-antitoxin system VapC family toxin [Geminicoccaceae bacterium]